jgi:FtsP/CotA-like multicopper oxidase with cupredoxin domain
MSPKTSPGRRDFLKASGLAALASGLDPFLQVVAQPTPPPGPKADYTLRIASARIELAPNHSFSTTAYNSQFPGPMVRLTEGRRVIVDLYNDTDTPEQFHWHGQNLPVDVDGAAEEGTPYIPAHGMRRVAFTPGPPGLRFYHSHLVAGGNLAAGLYSGQAGPVYIEPRNEPGRFDREVVLVLKEFEPTLSHGGDMDMNFLSPPAVNRNLQETGEAAMAASLARGMPHGYEVGYKLFSINGRMLGHGEPVRVRAGERVLFHIVNASATEIRSLALPGHTFTIVALDGNPVPTPAALPALWIGTAERVSAIVEMNHPGVWILGDLADDDRQHGMGIVVEYAGSTGKPQWHKPRSAAWDYTRFGSATPQERAPPEIIDMVFTKKNAALDGFNQWSINGVAFDMKKMTPMFHLRHGKRYHSFELTRVAGRATAGIMKDVVMLGGYQEMEVEFLADNPGLTLFHCHQQLHMDFGFMALFDYA